MNNLWRTDEPPKDGTEIVAIGRVLWQDASSGAVSAGSMPFIAAIRWKSYPDGFSGWCHSDSRGEFSTAVAQDPADQVKIDWWAPMPEGRDS